MDAGQLTMPQTAIEKDFGGELRKFDLSPIKAWRALEARCGVGIGRVFARLWSSVASGPTGHTNPSAFDFSGDDIREVIFQGLKGGGMPDDEASKLMRSAFDSAPGKGQFCALALEIVSAWWLGVPEGNEAATEMDSEVAAVPASSTSPLSTEQA